MIPQRFLPARLLVAACLVSAAACTVNATAPHDASPSAQPSHAPSAARAAHAAVELHDAGGAEIGTARFTEDATGVVHLTVHVRGISPGLHGLHLHTIGACVAGTTPAFSSAGAHYSPVAKEHGHDNPAGFHAGDLPNVTVNDAGVGHLNVKLEQFRLADLADADGTALVLHANEDDRRTNTGPLGPGNSGARIACGVVQGG
jgi:Cu-Zn family superoxide dismutase